MATYSDGVTTTIMLTTEGAAKANELKKNGIEVKVTHMRIFRTPTPVQEIPYKFTGLENKDTLVGWSALPNADTTFDVIENYPTVPMFGFMTLIGTLGAEVGTFSYDAVGLYLGDDTLYAICVTSRLLTKRKAAIGTTSNIQELSFNIAHSTTQEITDFRVEEKQIDYTKITEIQHVHELPKEYDVTERMFRWTNETVATYTSKDVFITTLVSQAMMKLDGSSTLAPVWIFSDFIKLFDRQVLEYTLTPDNKVHVSLPSSANYPAELISDSRTFVLSLADPQSLIEYPVLRLILDSDATDATGFNFVFSIEDVTLSITNPIKLQGILATRNDDGIYQDAIRTALRKMTEIQYSAGRRFKSDHKDHPNDLLRGFWGRESAWIKLDNRLEVSTSIYDSRLYTPSMLQPIINKPGSVDHMTLRASNIWINSENAGITPTLEIDYLTLFYGQFATATVRAPGVRDGSLIPWYVISPRSGGLSTPTKTYGYVEIQNGVGTFVINPNWNVVQNNDGISVGLVGYPDQDTLITIQQLVVKSHFSSDADGVDVITESDEGKTVYFNIQTEEDLSVNAILYLRDKPSAGVLSTSIDDFDELIPDYVTLNGTHVSIPIYIKNDDLTEGGETLELEVALSSAFDTILTSAGLNVNDTSINRNPVYQIYFSYDIAGARPIPNGVPAGLGAGTIYLIVKATDVTPSHPVTIQWSGDLDLTDDVAVAIPNPLNLTLLNGFVAYPITTVASVSETPTDPGGEWEVKELKITADRYTTYPLYEEFVKLFGAPKTNSSVKLTVASGVYVVGTDTTVPAIDCTGAWPAGVPIVIENDGYILGRGGNGGTIQRTTKIDGTNGGFALLAQQANPVTVNNRGTVAGGGGGGGGASSHWRFPSLNGSFSPTRVQILGGSGGRPLGLCNETGIVPNGYIGYVAFGKNATLTEPGSTPSIDAPISMGAMSGGDLAQAGTDGKGKTYNSKGGLAGFRSYGPVTINGGTILGNAG